MRLREGCKAFFQKNVPVARGGGTLKTNPKCEGGLTAEPAAVPPPSPRPSHEGRLRAFHNGAARGRRAALRVCALRYLI